MKLMHNVQLSEEVYTQAQRGAQIEGFPSVEAFIAHAVGTRLQQDEAETPAWMLAELDRGIADAGAGRVVSFEEY
jgi:predicted transcriptional regulator